jgi:hypothetical protein
MTKEYKNHLGQVIPAKYVPELDKRKDAFANSILKSSLSLSSKLRDFKTDLLIDAESIYYKMAEEANIDLTKRKGNMTICSFDKRIKIEVQVQDRIEFDDNITLAQDKINEYLRVKLTGTDHDIIELINSAFTTSKGKLDNKRIMSLFSIKIKHPIWIEAMELIRKSIQRNNSKRYIQVRVKDEEGAYKAIDLSIATI